MIKSNKRKWIISGVILVFLVALSFAVPAFLQIQAIPDHLYLNNGLTREIFVNSPLPMSAGTTSEEVVSLKGTSLGDGSYALSDPLIIEPKEDGVATLSVEIGGIPVKTVTVTVDNNKKLIPGGESIGVMLYTKGALVVGGSDITTPEGKIVNPAKEAGLKSGDVIQKVNGTEIEDADHLTQLINDCTQESLQLQIDRGGQEMSIEITPVQDVEDGLYRLGIWVRDSTAGVGTLTFYDPATQKFAGLGHAITDLDTGNLLSVKDGEIIVSDIMEINKGVDGEPGELRGNFNTEKAKLGQITENTNYGLYGDAYSPIENSLYQEPLPICSRDEVELGEAEILTTLDDTGVQSYQCQIVKINKQSEPEQKSFVIEVTDPVLLEKTGGIVQGMSGSPIIQNGKIVGAVTHVFVNDPKMGYGLYIDWMLNELYN